jgi:hypothetical protein
MKRLIFSFLIVLFGSFLYAAEPDSVFVSSSSNPIDRETCTCKGKRLYGKVKVVDVFADFKVEVVKTGCEANLWVKEIEPGYSCYSCGEWQFVETGEDFTVQFVETHGDFRITFVEIGSGIQF